MTTNELREYALYKGVPHWRIGKELGVCEMTVSRMLRGSEISSDKAIEIKMAIDKAYESPDRLPSDYKPKRPGRRSNYTR